MILSDIMPDVLDRIEEALPTASSFPGPVFWNLIGEVYPEMVNALFESTLITGVAQATSVPYTIPANTTYFLNPKGMVAPLRLKAPYAIRKVSLKSLDDMTPNWQSMVGGQLIAWFPLGCRGFGVFPQLGAQATVTMDWIKSPVNKARPYNGTEPIPYQEEFTDLISMYAAAALRAKEGGQEAEEASTVLQEYLGRIKALSLFQGRLDSLVYSASYGGVVQTNARSVV